MNVPAFALLAGISFLLLVIGLATNGIALILALPWLAAASYAAFRTGTISYSKVRALCRVANPATGKAKGALGPLRGG